jgi:hypothetical protein
MKVHETDGIFFLLKADFLFYLTFKIIPHGFKNIFTVQDPGIPPLFLKDGGVTKVTIGEASDFEKGDWFPAAAKIRVLHF